MLRLCIKCVYVVESVELLEEVGNIYVVFLKRYKGGETTESDATSPSSECCQIVSHGAFTFTTLKRSTELNPR